MPVNIDDTNMDDAQRYTLHGELVTGEIQETDRDSHVVWRFSVVDGVQHGPDRTWYPDGTPESETDVVDGSAIGTSRRWHTDGSLAEERDFDERGFVVALRRWDENGSPVEKGPGRPRDGGTR